jgi:hypothetical protein
MILKYLFTQYDNRMGPTFGSRVLKLLGTTFMGSPASKGLGHVREDLQKSYYYIKEDRILPQGDAALEEWQMQSILVNQYREVEAPSVARTATAVGLLVATLCVALAIPAQKANHWLKSGGSESTKDAGADENLSPTTYEGCVALQEKVNAGLSTSDIPNFSAVQKRCQELAVAHQQGGEE